MAWQSGHRTADSNEICDVPQSIERPSVREIRKTQARGCPHRFPDHKCRRHSEPPKTNRCVGFRGKWKDLVGKIPGYRALSFPQSPAGSHLHTSAEISAFVVLTPGPDAAEASLGLESYQFRFLVFSPCPSIFPIYPDSGRRRSPTYGGANPGVLVRPHVFDFCKGLFLVKRGQGRERRRPAPFHPHYACQ